MLKMNREGLSGVKRIFKQGRSRKVDVLHAHLQLYVAHTPRWKLVSLRRFYIATQAEAEENEF